MNESRNLIKCLVALLVLGSMVGAAHAGESPADDLDLDLQASLVKDLSPADLTGGDTSLTADAESLDPAVEPDCASDSGLTAALGLATMEAVDQAASSWTCGACSVSACANRPVGSPCGGYGLYCVVSVICPSDPTTDRCVCGTDHF